MCNEFMDFSKCTRFVNVNFAIILKMTLKKSYTNHTKISANSPSPSYVFQ